MKQTLKSFSLIIGLIILIISVSCNLENKKKEATDNQIIAKYDNSLTDDEISGGILTPEILWKFGRIGDAQISPDGNNVIYCITRYDVPTNKSITNIYSVSTKGGEPIQLTLDEGAQSNPRWIKNGEKIAYLSTKSGSVQIWEMNPDGTMQQEISDIQDGINSFEYSPSAKHVFYTKDVKLDKTPDEIHTDLPLVNVKIMDDLMYCHWNQWHDYKYSHVFIASYDNEKLNNHKDIMENERYDSPLSPYFDNTEISWSTDGKIIAYTCKKLTGKDYAVSTNSDIYLYYIESGKTENITDGMMGYDKYPVFSPDGKNIVFQSMETPAYEADKDRLMIYNIETKEIKYITENLDQNVSNLTWSEDNKFIYFISGIHATYQICKINIETNEYTQITKGHHNYNTFTKTKDVIIGEKMSMSMATEIFKVNENDGAETQITFTNQNIYDNIEMGKVEEKWIKTTDGKDMLVWLIYPPKFDANKKYPAILYCQGGPQSAVSQFFSFRWNFQIMAANDYVIVAPNRRGLPTFGQEWNAQISGDYSGQNIKDYFSAIDAFKTEPFINENRLGAIGASYGGYSVFYLAGHHNKRFKAFISHCGIYDFDAMYGSTEEIFFAHYDYGGAYWEKDNKIAQRSYANSPHKFIKNWDTPIMIITGKNDLRIPYTQSLEAFNCAQLRGIPSKLLFFPEETHFVLKPQNSILWQREFFGWLDKWLKNDEEK
ncbi:MAG: S9 family peptidase [Bacteroidales bacterium]|nr:S9 family peptidase [Bacteroidales bacterium]